MPVSRSSRREWWPASTTFGSICTDVPSTSVAIVSSPTSKPRSLSRRIRGSTRPRPPPPPPPPPPDRPRTRNLDPQRVVPLGDHVADAERVHRLVEQAARLQVEE